MRPVPRSRHWVAVLIFAAVAAAYGYFALLDEHPSDAQVEIAIGALKRHQPDLFRHDLVFGDSGLWKVNSPAIYGFLDMSLVPTGYRDPMLPFRIMAGVVAMIYLCAMYALLYRQCRSWSISAFVSVLSSTVIYALGGAYWGVGSLGSIAPRALCLAVTPLVVLGYLRYAERSRLPLVFAFIGLMGNLHLVTAMTLTIVLLIAYLGVGRFALLRWPMAIACGLCAAVAALPYTLYYLALRFAPAPPGASVSAEAAARGLGQLAVLYPGVLNSLLSWLLLVGLLAVPAGAVLLRVERFRARDLRLWVWIIIGGFFTTLVLHGLSQLVGRLRGTPPPVIDLVQASGLVMLPLYVLLAQALTNLFRMLRSYRNLLRWGCAVVTAAWMVPSENFRVARHALYDTATVFMKEQDRPLRVQELHSRHHRRVELAAIADWARTQTGIGAVFLVDRGEFRMLARRAIVVADEDVRYVYYLAPWRMEDCLWRSSQQGLLLRQGNAEGLRRFVGELRAREHLADVNEWYVVLQAGPAPEKTQGLEPIPSEKWGRQLQLYRLHPPQAAGSQPSSAETRASTVPSGR